MDTSEMLRPEELPFPIPQVLADDIHELIDAIERDDLCVDCYENEVESCARKLDEVHDMWIRRYYARGGWRRVGRNPQWP